MVKNWFRAVALILAVLPGCALAETEPEIDAHPALWTVHSAKGTVYLLGSIHLLPPNVQWQTPQIAAAMQASDTFLFETPIDDGATQEIQAYVAKNGTLPAGVTLPSLLSPAEKKDYEAALIATGTKPEAIANKRPWLAALVLDVAKALHQGYLPDTGVDRQVDGYALAHGKAIGHLETVADQLALLDPKDRSLEVKEFDINLKQILNGPDDFGDLLGAWERGDAKRVAAVMNRELASDPQAAKALLFDRNEKWVAEIKPMLERKDVYFITVGAGHLVGPHSVPALLRAAGYAVDGP